MLTLQEILIQARHENKAIGHFNISTLEMLRGIAEAAKEAGGVPTLIGTSENEAQFLGYRHAVALIQSFREEYKLPFFLNADHHKSVESAKKAIDAGYDSVHIDLSKLPYEENLTGTKEVVEYAKRKTQNAKREISVEGELGYLPTDSSKVFDEAVEINPEDFTKPEQAQEFIKKTGIDRFAPAVGNFHGMSTIMEKKLDFERIRLIRGAMPEEVAFVLHGGSGISHEQIKQAVQIGMNNVHISTELRVAYAEALRKSLADHPDETTPYKLLPDVVDAVKKVVFQKLLLFGTQ
ncbi:MAG: class II fructose-bisphosphate aldolase [Patescibacteria group bacterium]